MKKLLLVLSFLVLSSAAQAQIVSETIESPHGDSVPFLALTGYEQVNLSANDIVDMAYARASRICQFFRLPKESTDYHMANGRYASALEIENAMFDSSPRELLLINTSASGYLKYWFSADSMYSVFPQLFKKITCSEERQ